MAAKRLLAVFIAIIMVLSLAPAGVFTAFADGENVLTVGRNSIVVPSPDEYEEPVYVDFEFTPESTGEYWICSVSCGDPCCNIYGSDDSEYNLDDYAGEDGIYNFCESYTLTEGVTYRFSLGQYAGAGSSPLDVDLFINTADGYSVNAGEVEGGYIFAPPYAKYNDTVSFVIYRYDSVTIASDVKASFPVPGLGDMAYICTENNGLYSFEMPDCDVTLSCSFDYPVTDNATPLSLGDTELNIPVGSLGFYSFTAEEAGTYYFASHTSGCDPKASLLDDNMVSLSTSDDFIGTDFRIDWDLEAGETVYLAVSEYKYRAINGTLTVAKAEPFELMYHGLELAAGEIGVIFYTKVLDSVDLDGAYVEFLIGKSGRQQMEINDHSWPLPLTCYVGTYRMADKITPVIHWYDDEGVEQTIEFEPYSAEDYITYALDNPGSFDADEYDVVVALADLGYYTQQYLSGLHGYTVGDGENDKYAAFTTCVTENYRPETVSANLEDFYRYNADIDTDKVENIAFSLNLESSTALYIYLTVKDGVTLTRANDYSYDTDRELTRVSANVYRIAVRDIKAYALNSTYNIQVYDGEENVVADLSISPLNYIKIAIDSSNNDALTNAACAVYYYYDAVNTLVSNSVPDEPDDPDEPDEPDDPGEP